MAHDVGLHTPIKLIVGLGNPGPEYEKTRHNAGAWLVEALAADANSALLPEKKFHGLTTRISIAGQECHLLFPHTFMNRSGLSVKALAQFYKIELGNILIVHDELDLPVGRVQLKIGGGHGGHNGLRDIAQHFASTDFTRLRIGIGHPGDRAAVHNYVLGQPSKIDKEAIETAITQVMHQLPAIVLGDLQKAMRELHVKGK